MIVDGLFHYAV